MFRWETVKGWLRIQMIRPSVRFSLSLHFFVGDIIQVFYA